MKKNGQRSRKDSICSKQRTRIIGEERRPNIFQMNRFCVERKAPHKPGVWGVGVLDFGKALARTVIIRFSTYNSRF